ncbi:scc1 / rad21 family member [Anaeramoeba flamelloides]|uniref:Scc1 / rad21 family member n=1 Tax=Anaeramoeba flamelloides TaxID=1746091 RepID=A0AAV8AC25_9EUKA|nr:scc1 / rad21 family member [Anaeramoeba flamelloides]
MFFLTDLLTKKGPLSKVWLAGNNSDKLKKRGVLESNIPEIVDYIINEPRITLVLRISGKLLKGIVQIYTRKCSYMLVDVTDVINKMKLTFRPGIVDLPVDQTIAKFDSITLTEYSTSELLSTQLGELPLLIQPTKEGLLFQTLDVFQIPERQQIPLEELEARQEQITISRERGDLPDLEFPQDITQLGDIIPRDQTKLSQIFETEDMGMGIGGGISLGEEFLQEQMTPKPDSTRKRTLDFRDISDYTFDLTPGTDQIRRRTTYDRLIAGRGDIRDEELDLLTTPRKLMELKLLLKEEELLQTAEKTPTEKTKKRAVGRKKRKTVDEKIRLDTDFMRNMLEDPSDTLVDRRHLEQRRYRTLNNYFFTNTISNNLPTQVRERMKHVRSISNQSLKLEKKIREQIETETMRTATTAHGEEMDQGIGGMVPMDRRSFGVFQTPTTERRIDTTFPPSTGMIPSEREQEVDRGGISLGDEYDRFSLSKDFGSGEQQFQIGRPSDISSTLDQPFLDTLSPLKEKELEDVQSKKLRDYLKKKFETEETMDFSTLTERSNRKLASKIFFHLLVLKSNDFVDVKQDIPKGGIKISPGINL